MPKKLTATQGGRTLSGNALKTVLSNLGTGIKKVVANGVQYWTKSVILHNPLSSAATSSAGLDSGTSDYWQTLLTINVTKGHRYYVRSAKSGWGAPSWGWNDVTWDGSPIGASVIMEATETKQLLIRHHWTGSTPPGTSSGWHADLYQVVDITEYQDDLGRVITTADMEAIGIFYGDKEVET